MGHYAEEKGDADGRHDRVCDRERLPRLFGHHGDSACRLRPPTPTKHKGQHKPRQKSADVRHVSDATRLRCVGNGTDAAKKLQNDPEPNGHQRGHLNHLLALQYFDPSLGTFDPALNANCAKVAASPQSR